MEDCKQSSGSNIFFIISLMQHQINMSDLIFFYCMFRNGANSNPFYLFILSHILYIHNLVINTILSLKSLEFFYNIMCICVYCSTFP